MKQILAITITDEDIRYSVETAVEELEEENQLAFPDSGARAEFIEDCIRAEIDRVELYGSNPFRSRKDYTIDVLDTAKLYGYTL